MAEDPSHSPPPIGPAINNIFDPAGWDRTYFKQFRDHPHELSYLAVHNFLYLQMKSIYYYQMELLKKYPSGTVLDQNNIQQLRELLASYCT